MRGYVRALSKALISTRVAILEQLEHLPPRDHSGAFLRAAPVSCTRV